VSEVNFLDKYNELRAIGPSELVEIWHHYDRDASGFIEAGPELESFLTDMLRAGGEQVTELKVKEFIDGVLELFDINADGKLSLTEVEALLNSG
jgi:Ca2+-binding EF-hand superfamily protein